MNFDRELDGRNLKCFMLTLAVKKELNQLAAGKVLKIVANSPDAMSEFSAFARQTGNELIASNEANSEHAFFFRKT